jgi:hypothetical protein
VPDLVLKDGSGVVTVAPANLSRALASGLYEAPDAGATTQISTATGVVDVPIEQAGTLQANYGDAAATPGQVGELEREGYLDREHGGALGAIGTGIEQGLNEATFGGYGVVAGAVAGDDYVENMAERDEAHPLAGQIGGVAGMVLPALATGGETAVAKLAGATGTGGAARLAEAIVAKGVGKGLIAETAAAAAGYGVEGALLGSGHVLAETVLHDKELSGEAFVAGAEEGALWGGAGGGAASLLSRGTKWAKGAYEGALEKRASLVDLEAAHKAAKKEADLAAKEASRLRIQNEKSLNQRAMEELRQKGRLDLVEARGTSKLEAIDAGTAAKKDVAGFTAEQKLKLEEYRHGSKKEIAEIGADARLRQTELTSEAKLKVADKHLEKEMAKAEARSAVARAKLDEVSERLAVEQERTARAKLVMQGRQDIADTYTGGWKRAAESREAVAASKLDATVIGADSRTRVGLADALAKSAHPEAGTLIADMMPASMRTPKAVQVARADVATQASRLASTTDDLVRQVDDLIAVNPAAAEDLLAIRNAAAESVPAVSGWTEKAAQGVDDFAEGFQTIRDAEQAQHDLAQGLKMHLDEAGVPSAHLDELTRPMDEAVGRTDEIVESSVAKQVDAAIGSGGGDKASAAAVADMLLGAAGLPNAEDIPVIGPVLGAYLKLRAAHGVLGKFGIRVPGPVGKIAAIGSRVQGKASEVIHSIVTHAPSAAKVVERASPSLTTTLSRPLWEPLEGGSRADAKGDPLKLYKQRLEELDRAMSDPEGTRQKILDSIPAPPTVAAAIADKKMAQLEYLHSVAPADPRGPTVRPSETRVNSVEIRRFAEQKRAVEAPVEHVKDMIDGRASPLGVEAIKKVYPRLYQQMQDELVDKLSEATGPIPFARLIRAALVFDVPLDTKTTPEYGGARQAEYAEARQTAQPTPTSGGPELRLSNLEEPGSRRRALR